GQSGSRPCGLSRSARGIDQRGSIRAWITGHRVALLDGELACRPNRGHRSGSRPRGGTRPRQRTRAGRYARTLGRRRWQRAGRSASRRRVGGRAPDARHRRVGRWADAMISVVVADDQAVVRDGLILLLSANDEINVVGAAADGPGAVALIEQTQPRVALLDLRIPGLYGAEVTALLATRAPSTRALILTTYADDEAVLPALRAGAAGYLTKDATGETLLKAIRDVAAGQTVLDA